MCTRHGCGELTVMKTVNASIPEAYARAIDEFVKSGEYTSRNEFVRDAVRDKLISRNMIKVTVLKSTSTEATEVG